MRIHLIFATNSSGTAEAATTMADVLRQSGHEVKLERAQDVDPGQVGKADLTILGSCTWERFENGRRIEGDLQEHMYALVQELRRRKLKGKRLAIFGLGDSSYTEFCNAANHLKNFLLESEAVQVGETLKIDGWFFNHAVNRNRARDWARELAKAS